MVSDRAATMIALCKVVADFLANVDVFCCGFSGKYRDTIRHRSDRERGKCRDMSQNVDRYGAKPRAARLRLRERRGMSLESRQMSRHVEREGAEPRAARFAARTRRGMSLECRQMSPHVQRNRAAPCMRGAQQARQSRMSPAFRQISRYIARHRAKARAANVALVYRDNLAQGKLWQSPLYLCWSIR